MSRTDVLVDADWVEAHIDDPKVAIVEGTVKVTARSREGLVLRP